MFLEKPHFFILRRSIHCKSVSGFELLHAFKRFGTWVSKWVKQLVCTQRFVYFLVDHEFWKLRFVTHDKKTSFFPSLI